MDIVRILTAFTLSTRFYNLSVPSYVCWDETHFGKFVGLYMNQTYFLDVHPPLGKLLLTVAGFLTGNDGNFAFASPGDEYITESYKVHYYGMRAFSAILGSLVIPLSYCTVKNMTGSDGAALLTAIFLILDCGLITLSQYILLDPILLFFMSATLFCTTKYSTPILKRNLPSTAPNNHLESFTPKWWMYLSLSAAFLGCTVAIKWTGLFTMTFIGCWAAKDIWNFFQNIVILTWKKFLMHFLARALCLLFIPCCIYVSVFAVHYQVLNKSGKSDGFHSSLFQSCLKGNPLHNTSMPLHLAYGSVISLKYHSPPASGFLHSYNKPYPPEVMPFHHQQVSLYYHRDVGNFWEVLKFSESDSLSPGVDKDQADSNYFKKEYEIDFLQGGSLFRLRHLRTGHYLSDFSRPAVLSPLEHIIAGRNSSDEKSNDVWRLEVADSPGLDGKIEVLKTTFWLVNANTGCRLRSTAKILPEWGEKKHEVACSVHSYHKRLSLWNAEQHTHRHMADVKLLPCQMTFWEKFSESHRAMMSFNLQFKPTENASKPWHWPINYRGQVFSRLGEDDIRVYLLGNPLIFWLNLLVLLLLPIFLITARNRSRFSKTKQKPCIQPMRGHKTLWNVEKKTAFADSPHLLSCKLFMLGWAIHYLPFFFLSRVVYFHHYYPAFLFSCCLSGCFIDFIFTVCSAYLSRLVRHVVMPSKIKSIIYFIIISCALESFFLYSPLCYGMTGSFADDGGVMRGLKFFDQWDI